MNRLDHFSLAGREWMSVLLADGGLFEQTGRDGLFIAPTARPFPDGPKGWNIGWAKWSARGIYHIQMTAPGIDILFERIINVEIIGRSGALFALWHRADDIEVARVVGRQYPPTFWSMPFDERRFVGRLEDGTIDVEVDLDEADVAVERMRAAIAAHLRLSV